MENFKRGRLIIDFVKYYQKDLLWVANDRIPEKGRHPPKQVIVSDQEKRERARAALKVNESIAKERTTLVQQLDQLREENKLLKVQKYSKNCSDTHEERKSLSKKI